MNKIFKTLPTLLCSGALLSAPAEAADPYKMPDDSWISMSGTVVQPSTDSFLLDYGEGVVTVEVDDWDAYGDAYGLMEGDRVTVYGEVDDDLYERAKIEAGSVYVENLNTYFYASSDDEERGEYAPYYWSSTVPIVLARTTVRGTVTSVDASQRKFTIDTGNQKLTVETDRMSYNPLDDTGYQQIDQGDRVSASGVLNDDFFEGRVLEADFVVTLLDDANS